jgi:anti-sigma B factor antagonist
MTEDRVCRVTMHGDLTLGQASQLRAALREAVAAGPAELVVDLAACEMLDSSGIGLLVSACNSMEQIGGGIRVVGVSDDILHLLRSIQLDKRLGASGRNNPEVTHG